MNRTAFLMIGICLLAVSACGQDKSPPPVSQPNNAPVTAPPSEEAAIATNWSFRVEASCDGKSRASCAGGYGISLSQGGEIMVGPGPEGQNLEETMTPDDFAALGSIAERLSRSSATASNESCSDGATGPDTRISFRPRAGSSDVLVARVSGKQFCHRLKTDEDARSMQKTLQGIVQKYYPLPFPDDCLTAAYTFHKQFLPIQRCLSDADCTYVDENFSPLKFGTRERIIRDDCSPIRHLVVANSFELIGHQRDLLDSREIVRDCCRNSRLRAGCEKPAAFSALDTAPLCINNMCAINPAVKSY